MTTNDFLARLERVKKTSQGWEAQCPAHEDGRQSLSIKEGEKGIVCKCHAGCEVKDIASAMKLKLADLFYEKKGGVKQTPAANHVGRPSVKASPTKHPGLSQGGTKSQPGKIVAEYDYFDEAGNLLFQVVRMEPKDFRQRAPDLFSKGKWNWKTGDIRKVLWRLPTLLKADPATPVFICEGEKDVLACEKAGLLATCNPGGAGVGKWLTAYTVSLEKFSRIIVVSDKDEPGRKHSWAVAQALSRSNRHLKIIEVPGDKNKDAADFFQAGGTADQLMTLAAGTPNIQPADAAICDPAGTNDKLPPCVFDLGRQKYFIPNGPEWMPVNDTRIGVHFRARGYSDQIRDNLGVTKLESALQKVMMEHSVKYAGPVAGYWAGPHEMEGKRVLVTESPRLIEPKKGKWERLQTLTERMFVDEKHKILQWTLFCMWLRAGYIALRDKTLQPGLALILCGKSDNGKSFLGTNCVVPILGGRSGQPYKWMIGETNFNDDWMGSEVLMLDDEASEKDIKSRTALGQRIKQILVGGAIRFDGKFVKAVTARPYFRLLGCLNDGASDLMVLPPMDDSIRKKFLILRLGAGEFPSLPNDFQKLVTDIRSELPAFLHWLLNDFKPVEKWHSPRFGVLNWQHPDLLFEMEDLHPWRRLLEFIDHVGPWGKFDQVWEGTVQDLHEVLTDEEPGRAQGVLRGLQGTGMDLRAAAERLPGRISSRDSNGKKIWIIKKPTE